LQEQKISKLKDQMLQAKTNEQFSAFQKEIDFCTKEIRKSEDRILELMGESEALDRNVKAAEGVLKTEKAEGEAEKQQARERTATDRKGVQEFEAERAGIVASVKPSTYQRYERSRKLRKGIAVAEVVAGRCSLCNIVLRLQFIQDLKKAEDIMVCESCQRILYYNPPESFEDLASEQGRRVSMS